MRGRGKQAARVLVVAGAHEPMETRCRHTQYRWMATNLVAGQQRRMPIEAAVFHRLGVERRAEQLGPLPQRQAAAMQRRVILLRWRRQHPRGDLLDRSHLVRRAAGDGRLDGLLPQPTILSARSRVGEIAAVHREVTQQGQRRARQQGPAEISGDAAGEARKADEAGDEGIELGAQAVLQHVAPGLQFHLAEAAGVTGDLLPVPCQRVAAGTAVQQCTDLVHEVVAGGAIARPVRPQGFIRRQDLLHPQAQRARRQPTAGAGSVQRCAQPVQVTGRIAESIHVVHAQAIHPSLRHQAQRKCMHGLEDIAAVHLQRDQRGNGEEATVVDPVIATAPPRQPVGLRRQHAGQGRCRQLRPARGPGRGRQRIHGAVVRDARRSVGGALHGEHAFGDRAGQRPIQHRQPQLAVTPRCAPGDVEPAGMRAGLAVGQHIGPIRIERVRRHVVRHDIQDQAHPACAHGVGKTLQSGLPAQLRIDRGGIDDVVAMRGTGHRAGDRRQVQVTDAQ